MVKSGPVPTDAVIAPANACPFRPNRRLPRTAIWIVRRGSRFFDMRALPSVRSGGRSVFSVYEFPEDVL